MENEVKDLRVYDDTETPEMAAVYARPRKKKRSGKKIALIVLLSLVILGAGSFAAVYFGVPAVKYYSAVRTMESGDRVSARIMLTELGDYRDAKALLREIEKADRYDVADRHMSRDEFDDARRIFAELGDFKDAPDRVQEAENGLQYRKALTLLEQGDREGAKALLETIVSFRDAGEVLRGIEYDLAVQLLEEKEYLAARDAFEALGTDYRDCAEKIGECTRLYEKKVQRDYSEGCRLIVYGDLTGAYRMLNAIADANYSNTAEKIDEILTTSVRLAEKYAAAGDRPRTLAFLRLVEEIDPEQGAALRARLIPAEEFKVDGSFYLFNTDHINSLTNQTTREELSTVVLYMILYGEMNMGLTSHKEVDRITMVDRAFQSCDMVSEILPGHGSVYNPSVQVGDRYVNFRLNVEQKYSEFQRTQHIKLFKEFCESSVLALAEAGLLSDSMSARQKVEVIANWVGFYLTYDQTLETHDVGVAVETTSGVCEAYAAIHNRMCNLAGVRTYGQIGDCGAGLSNARHIWSFHLDENGEIFYSDTTWADPYSLDFSRDKDREPTVELFVEYYLDRCMRAGVIGKEGTYGAEENMYICVDQIWGSHRAERTPEEIMNFHNIINRKS